MATNPAVKEVYPFSTRDGESIPLDIIAPLSLLVKSFPASGVADFTLPTGFDLGSLYSAKGCILQMLNPRTLVQPLLDGVEYTGTILIPPATILTASLTVGLCRLTTLDGSAGTLYIQNIRKWAALALPQQVRVK